MDEERTILLGPLTRKGKWRRRCVLTLGVLVAAALTAWFVLARSPVTRMIVLPQVERYLSVIADADSVHLGFDGVVTVKGLTLTAPGFARPGEDHPPHARFFQLDDARVYLDWPGILNGNPRVVRVEAEGGLIRLSQDIAVVITFIPAFEIDPPAIVTAGFFKTQNFGVKFDCLVQFQNAHLRMARTHDPFECH